MAIKLALSLEMMKDNHKFNKMGTTLHTSAMRHDWYLWPQLVVLLLADDEVDNKEKIKILEKLLDYNIPTKF